MSKTIHPRDALQWYWSAANGSTNATFSNAGDRFVIAQGQENLWRRVRREVDASEHCGWMPFGSGDTGEPTLGECFRVLMTGREVYGANLNRVVAEMVQVHAFAAWVAEGRGAFLHQTVSNPIQGQGHPLSRPGYDNRAAEALGLAVARTLGLRDGWWR